MSEEFEFKVNQPVFIGIAPHRHQLKKLIVPQNEKNKLNSHK